MVRIRGDTLPDDWKKRFTGTYLGRHDFFEEKNRICAMMSGVGDAEQLWLELDLRQTKVSG